jgi:hypothetical protein
MSYARFGWNGSDVYIFLHVGGFIQCCGCQFGNDGYGSYDAYSTQEMVDHLKKHEADGDHVPQDVYEGLWEDHDENTYFIKEANSKQLKLLLEEIEHE